MKKYLFLVMALTCALPGFAQSDDGEEEFAQSKSKSNAFFIGPKAGVTFTSMTQPNEGKLYDASGIGFSGGIALKARFGKASDNSVGGTGYLGAGVEVKYLQNTVKTLGTDEGGKEKAKLSLGYLDIPVYVQVYPFAKNANFNSLYIELGAAFAGTITRTPKSLTLENPNEGISSVTYNIDKDNSKLKGWDIRPMAGIGYTIPGTGLDINARYQIGLNKLAGNFPCKMNTLEVSVAWLFNIGRF